MIIFRVIITIKLLILIIIIVIKKNNNNSYKFIIFLLLLKVVVLDLSSSIHRHSKVDLSILDFLTRTMVARHLYHILWNSVHFNME